MTLLALAALPLLTLKKAKWLNPIYWGLVFGIPSVARGLCQGIVSSPRYHCQ